MSWGRASVALAAAAHAAVSAIAAIAPACIPADSAKEQSSCWLACPHTTLPLICCSYCSCCRWWVRSDGTWFMCGATLVSSRVVITAAHVSRAGRGAANFGCRWQQSKAVWRQATRAAALLIGDQVFGQMHAACPGKPGIRHVLPHPEPHAPPPDACSASMTAGGRPRTSPLAC